MTDTPHLSSLIFVSGGARSGKSGWAERLIATLAPGGPRVYLATSPAGGEEMRARIARHQAARAGRGFLTVERERDLTGVIPQIPPGSSVLLESLTAWLANEMFSPDGSIIPYQRVKGKILLAARALRSHCRRLVVVSDDIFSDGVSYAPPTAAYLRLLGELHQALAAEADAAVECAAGVARLAKGTLPAHLFPFNFSAGSGRPTR